MSYTAPGLDGQSEVIAEALGHAGVAAESISYIEAHGTATKLGDAVELAAMKKAFGLQTDKRQFCAIGSVKPNVGHLDRASGVTGLIKTALALQHKQLPPSLNFEHASAEVGLEAGPFYVNTQLRAWESNGAPRRAGVSSFGLGGTNAHVVLEEGPEREPSSAARPWQLLLLSARSGSALEQATDNLRRYLQEHEEHELADVAYTLQVGRSAFNYRQVVVCREREETIKALETGASRQVLRSYQTQRERPVAFLFPGVGEQYVEIAQDLYEQEPKFRAVVEQCCDVLKTRLGLDLCAVLFPDGKLASAASQRQVGQGQALPVHFDVCEAQSAVFVIEYALAQLLMGWGIRPRGMLGYDVGEYVAACLAGVFSLDDALVLVTRRAQLIAEQPEGAMLELLRDSMKELVSGFTLNAPQIPFISSAAGCWITEEQATDPAYWSAPVCQSAGFAKGIEHLWEENEYVFVEVGPGQSLSALVEQHPACNSERLGLVVATMPPVCERHFAQADVLTALGKLWLAGATIDWNGFYAQERRRRVSLPTYPFERQRYWIEPPRPSLQEKSPAGSLIGKKADIADWFYLPHWEQAALPPTRQMETGQGPWLVFEDGLGLGTEVVERLIREGGTCICVRIGDEFIQTDEQHFVLRPQEAADYRALCEVLSSAGQLPRSILHLWSVTKPGETGEAASGPDGFKVLQDRGFYSLLFLAQALGAQGYREQIQINMVSNGMQAVTGSEVFYPEKVTLLGACKVITQEYHDIKCRSIDLDQNILCEQRVIDQLMAECAGQGQAGRGQALPLHFNVSDGEPAVAYCDGVRWVQTYRPVRLGISSVHTPTLRQQGVYLITGGLGNVGLVLAAHLAKTAQARLVLVGRSDLPARHAWEQWLENHEATESTRRKIERIRALEELGAEVLVLQADVADQNQMQVVIQQIYERFGDLHGVIHAAGISNEAAFRAVQDTGRKECEWHFQPKVYGTYVLERVLEGHALDFCVVFSSLAAVLGGLGFVGYTAANSFLDAFVVRHNQTATVPWISVNWDSWQVKENPHGVLGGTIAAFAMTPEEGMEAFTRLLASGERQVIHSTGDLQARIQQWIQLEALLESDQGEQPATAGGVRSARVQKLSSRSECEQKITEIWQQVLGIEQVGLSDNFFDLGGNSLSALQVLARLKKAFHVQLPMVALFEAPTISALVDYFLPADQTEAIQEQDVLTQRRQEARQAVGQHEIAIIGLSGRFPGASSIEHFWHNLRNGEESVCFFSDEELLVAGVAPLLLKEPNYVKARPILEQIDQFDAAFFGYSPREATLTDPQHRLFLECAWEALEQAGYDAFRYAGLVGVFGGTNISTYLLGLASQPEVLGTADTYQMMIGNDKDSLTTSVSYKLNLKGPSLAVQTFCSTSLVAVHLAAQSLRQGECDLALAGGVSIRVPSVSGHLYQEGGMESPDGHCRTFDAQAKGGMFGDGVGVIVLKRLAEAREDGDQILAVLKGSAINNDGSLKVSYTAPSVTGQAEVVSAALEQAGVEAETISYIEAHGTATELGDPIEVTSLTRAYRRQTDKVGYCAIGSVKTNIGHLDRAAGVSGLIKTILALQHKEIPASLHFQTPNPEIDFASSPFYVNTRLQKWTRQGGVPRRAGVNSLGMGGTNAHVVLEEAPEREPSGLSRPWQLLLLSAKTETALEQTTRNLAAHLQSYPNLPLADVAYTLQVGRSRFEQRRMVVCRDREEALHLLEQRTTTHVVSRFEQRTERAVAFLFPGVGEQYVGVAQELYEQEPIFHEAVERCCNVLKTKVGLDLREVLFSGEQQTSRGNHHANGHNGTSKGRMDFRALLGRAGKDATFSQQHKHTALAQPAVFVIEYALARLLMEWGIRPQAMLGYSLGEYVAACLAGVFSVEDALMLVAKRAQLIAQVPAGAMLAVAISEEAVQPYLGEQINLAAVNSLTTCVVAGPLAAIEQLEARLQAQGIAAQRVETTHAFHSSMLESLYEAVQELVGTVKLHAPQIPYISNVTGTWITAEQATDPAYWAAHLCQTVRFTEGVGHLLEEVGYVLVEVGPGQSLSSLVKQHPACSNEQFSLVVPILPALYEQQSGQASLLMALGKLWLAGVTLHWSGFYAQERRQRVSLPTYPFERQRYWIEPKKRKQALTRATTHVDFVDEELERMPDMADWFYLPSWKRSMAELPFAAGKGGDDKRCWLLLLDECGIGEQVAEQLVCHGQEVITVLPGASFSRLSEHAYLVNPTARTDYESVLRALQKQGKIPQHVVHLWSVSRETTGHYAADNNLSATLARGFYSLLALTQAVGDMELAACQLAVVSNNVQDVTGNEQLCPEKATVLGPCKVIPQEYANIQCRSIDICLAEAGSRQEKELMEHLLGELTSATEDPVVALRGNHRWVPTFERVPLPGKADQVAQSRLRKEGVYLITGGLGGIALAMAEYLARTFQARLILTSRSELPSRDEWDGWLENHELTDSNSLKIRQVQSLETLGAEVLLLQADVCDEAQMRTGVEQAITTFGIIHGVFHAAGVPASGLIQLKQPEMAASTLAPKMMGTLVLERVLKDLPLDFLVLFSSMSSITGGGPGQVDYCAANAFLDAYARCHFSRHGMTVAIDWGEWQWDAWQAGLLGFPEEAQTYFRERRHTFGITFEEGMEALTRILTKKLPQVVVSTQDFVSMVAGSKHFSITTIVEKTQQLRQVKPMYARSILGTPYVAPENEMEQEIAAIWSELLGFEQVGIHDNFFELGGHSLMGMQMISRLRQAFAVDVRLTTLFEAPTVAELALTIELMLIEEIDKLDEEEVRSIVEGVPS